MQLHRPSSSSVAFKISALILKQSLLGFSTTKNKQIGHVNMCSSLLFGLKDMRVFYLVPGTRTLSPQSPFQQKVSTMRRVIYVRYKMQDKGLHQRTT